MTFTLLILFVYGYAHVWLHCRLRYVCVYVWLLRFDYVGLRLRLRLVTVPALLFAGYVCCYPRSHCCPVTLHVYGYALPIYVALPHGSGCGCTTLFTLRLLLVQLRYAFCPARFAYTRLLHTFGCHGFTFRLVTFIPVVTVYVDAFVALVGCVYVPGYVRCLYGTFVDLLVAILVAGSFTFTLDCPVYGLRFPSLPVTLRTFDSTGCWIYVHVYGSCRLLRFTLRVWFRLRRLHMPRVHTRGSVTLRLLRITLHTFTHTFTVPSSGCCLVAATFRLPTRLRLLRYIYGLCHLHSYTRLYVCVGCCPFCSGYTVCWLLRCTVAVHTRGSGYRLHLVDSSRGSPRTHVDLRGYADFTLLRGLIYIHSSRLQF